MSEVIRYPCGCIFVKEDEHVCYAKFCCGEDNDGPVEGYERC